MAAWWRPPNQRGINDHRQYIIALPSPGDEDEEPLKPIANAPTGGVKGGMGKISASEHNSTPGVSDSGWSGGTLLGNHSKYHTQPLAPLASKRANARADGSRPGVQTPSAQRARDVSSVCLQNVKASGSNPVRVSSLSASIDLTSSAFNVKSKTSAFSRIRSACTDFGMTTTSCSRCQRRIT